MFGVLFCLVPVVALALAGLAAIGATGRLVSKAFFSVKRLLAFGKDKVFAAVFAFHILVCHN